MAGPTRYPLEEIALIKQKRLEESEKVLKLRKEVLEREEEALQKAEKQRDEVKKHKFDKIRKYLAEMDLGTTSDKIQIHERYIKKVVDEELKIEEKKVADQKKVVKAAEEALEKAREDYFHKNQEVEKLSLHRKEWRKEQMVEEARLETIETDELGSNIHVIKGKTHPFSAKKGAR